MKKSSLRILILLLPVLAMLIGLMALPTVCLAQENLSVTMSLDKGPIIQAGDSVTVTLTPSGGRPPYTYRHIMIVYEQGVSHHSMEDVPDNSYTWMVGFGESALLISYVWDADWKEASCETTLTVQGSTYSPFTVTSRSLSPGDVINVGEPITYSVIAQGGQPPYSYSYRLTLYQDDCWFEPEDGSVVRSSNSFSYTPTRGTKGYISSDVMDAVGRKAAFQAPLMFTILGDEHEPMGLSATHSVTMLNTNDILGHNKFWLTIQASAAGGTPPVRFYCLWTQFKDGEIADRVYEENRTGKFMLKGTSEMVTGAVWAKDADGWTSDHIRFTFDHSIPGNQPLFERIKINPLITSLNENLFGPGWWRLPAQLYEFLETDESPDPIPEEVMLKPVQFELVKPRLIKPEATAPATAEPKTVQPGLLQPATTTKPPALKLPSPPKP